MNKFIANHLHDVVLHNNKQGRHDIHSKHKLKHVKERNHVFESECFDSGGEGSESELDEEQVKHDKTFTLEDSDDDSVQVIPARKKKSCKRKDLENRKRVIKEIEEEEIKQSIFWQEKMILLGQI